VSFFNASIGTKLVLELEGIEQRFGSFLVGYSVDKFFLITTPSSEHIFSVRPVLFIGRTINVRYLEEGKVIGFQSRLMKSIEEPEKLLFLSYPKVIEDHELRKDKRLPCALPAELTTQGLVCHSVVVDINHTGLRFQLKNTEETSLWYKTNHVGQECTLSFSLPGDSVPQEISGEIRNYMHSDRYSILGVKYTKISAGDEQKIIEYESKLLI
jgi:hypothetical protein